VLPRDGHRVVAEGLAGLRDRKRVRHSGLKKTRSGAFRGVQGRSGAFRGVRGRSGASIGQFFNKGKARSLRLGALAPAELRLALARLKIFLW
jgi:hypothetical protein